MRRLAYLALIVISTVAGLAGWLAGSEHGLQTAVRLAGTATDGQLHIEQASGRLLGPLDIATLRWQGAGQHVAATGIHLDWSPADLLHGRLQLAALDIATLRIDQPPSDVPAALPADLQLPLAVAIERLSLGQADYNGQPLLQQLRGRLASDGRQHRLDDLQLQAGDVSLAGQASLDGQAPFPLAASLDLHGQLEQRPLAVTATAKGRLDRIDLGIVATQGIAGHAEAVLTPFAAAPFASARLQLERIDPASWRAGAPQAQLSLLPTSHRKRTGSSAASA